MKEELNRQINTRMINEDYVEKKCISTKEIKEILGIEEDIDNEKLLSLLQTIVDENVRLEEIEDRKVQIEYNNVFNKGVKSVEDKIKAKIEYCREILYSFEKELELKANKDKFIHKESMNCLLGQISILQSLLEKE